MKIVRRTDTLLSVRCPYSKAPRASLALLLLRGAMALCVLGALVGVLVVAVVDAHHCVVQRAIHTIVSATSAAENT